MTPLHGAPAPQRLQGQIVAADLMPEHPPNGWFWSQNSVGFRRVDRSQFWRDSRVLAAFPRRAGSRRFPTHWRLRNGPHVSAAGDRGIASRAPAIASRRRRSLRLREGPRSNEALQLFRQAVTRGRKRLRLPLARGYHRCCERYRRASCATSPAPGEKYRGGRPSRAPRSGDLSGGPPWFVRPGR